MKIIFSKKAALITGAWGQLLPGVNQLEDAQWKAASETFIVKAMLKTGELEDRSPKDASALKDIPRDQAIALIKKTYDLTLLAKWKSEDERTSIVDAIASQERRIEAATKKPSAHEAPPSDPNLENEV